MRRPGERHNSVYTDQTQRYLASDLIYLLTHLRLKNDSQSLQVSTRIWKSFSNVVFEDGLVNTSPKLANLKTQEWLPAFTSVTDTKRHS